MNAGPILLIGGAALVLLAGKKKGGGAVNGSRMPLDPNMVPPPPGAPPVTPAPLPKPGANVWHTRQAWLKHLYALQVCTGCDPGTLDGKYGPNTKKAIMKFQAYAGIFPDGQWNSHTEAAMKRALANPWGMPGAEARLPGYGGENGQSSDGGEYSVFKFQPNINAEFFTHDGRDVITNWKEKPPGVVDILNTIYWTGYKDDYMQKISDIVPKVNNIAAKFPTLRFRVAFSRTNYKNEEATNLNAMKYLQTSKGWDYKKLKVYNKNIFSENDAIAQIAGRAIPHIYGG